MAKETQALDPELCAVLEEQAYRAPDLQRMADAERVQAVRASLPRALGQRDSIAGLPNAVKTRALTLDAGVGAQFFTPPGIEEPRPLLVYLHGGGWVGGSLSTHEPFCCLLSEAAQINILSVDYRQPPEHPFPAALDDAVAAVRWAASHAADVGADPERLAIGGDSAGGNLAAAAANRLVAEEGAPRLRAQLLLYPVTDHPSAHHPSYESNGTGYGLTAEAMHWFWRQYAPDAEPDNPDLSPLRREKVPPLPATLVVTAEYDVLRDEGRAYADKLREAGVAVTCLHAPDMNHNFPVSPLTVGRLPQSRQALAEIAGWLRATLHVRLPALRQKARPA